MSKISITFWLVGVCLFMSACSPISAMNDPLQDTTWKLSDGGKTKLIEGRAITIHFKDGRINGTAGCNSYGGRYRVYGDRIVVQELFSTMMACPEPEGIMEQEQRYLGYLGDAQTYQINDGKLLVYWSEYKALTFVPAALK